MFWKPDIDFFVDPFLYIFLTFLETSQSVQNYAREYNCPTGSPVKIKMDENIKKMLIALGFDENIEELPKLKERMKQNYKLPLKVHPYKSGCNTEKFKIIEEAVRVVIDYINSQDLS